MTTRNKAGAEPTSTTIENEHEWLSAFRDFRDRGGSASALRSFLSRPSEPPALRSLSGSAPTATTGREDDEVQAIVRASVAQERQLAQRLASIDQWRRQTDLTRSQDDQLRTLLGTSI